MGGGPVRAKRANTDSGGIAPSDFSKITVTKDRLCGMEISMAVTSIH